MKNENKMRGRGVQFGLKRENQNNPKSKNQKKMTIRGRGIEVKKLNRKRREKERKKRKMKKRKRKKEGEKRGRKRRTRKLPARPPTEKPNVTIHPVAPANYIMIFNGPKSKTRPSKIFGSGISWDGWEFSEMTQFTTLYKSQVSNSIKKYKKKSHESRGSGS